ncbi:MAG: hypothetical protein PHX16_02125 [Syntrophaceticus sp.]|nr:hypothetical protein [Syntrophaceticus sp.]MDD3315598.1 hypothetical protein [Syntrophaceticus sp.]MDD4359792.1 hypothetical protein [Syntrophaceticus sp.]MDD4782430.1 hypothetical protein [Syntrophaceticus sp.]
MKSKKVLVICLVAVLALSLMGFGFARWADDVAIKTTVATGNVDISIQALGDDDNGADPQVKGKAKNAEGKDVAQTNLTAVAGDSDTLNLAITNAYPWYKTGFTFKIKGEGTVPVKLEKVECKNVVDANGLKDFIVVDGWKVTQKNPASNGLPPLYKEKTGTGWNDLVKYLTGNAPANATAGDVDIDCKPPKQDGLQIHQGGWVKVDLDLHIKEDIFGCGGQITRTAPQNSNFAADVTFEAVQWNEYGIDNSKG